MVGRSGEVRVQPPCLSGSVLGKPHLQDKKRTDADFVGNCPTTDEGQAVVAHRWPLPYLARDGADPHDP
jgi:hypothetical protein